MSHGNYLQTTNDIGVDTNKTLDALRTTIVRILLTSTKMESTPGLLSDAKRHLDACSTTTRHPKVVKRH